MSKQNYMEEVAKVLGLKIGERFHIVGVSDNPFIKDMNKQKRSDYFTYEEMFRTLDDLRKVYLGESH